MAEEQSKQRAPRRALLIRVEYADSGEFLAGWTENISKGGFFVRTDVPLEVGQELHLALSFPGVMDPVEVAGTVVWQRGAVDDEPAGVGVQVNSDKGRRRLAQLALQTSELLAGKERPGVFKVLIVEDNDFVLNTFRVVLGNLGKAAADAVGIGSARNGRQALALCEKDVPDLVITDVYMPVLDGFGLVEGLRNKEETSTVPIIVVTGSRADVEDRLAALGVDAIIQKPVRFGELLETIVYLIHLQALADAG